MSAEDWFDQGDDYVPLRPKIRTDGTAYAQDRDGNRVYPGDYVRCAVGGYLGLKRGERRRVISVSMDTLVMRNKHSPTGTSAYQPRNFTLSERHHAWHKTQEAKMAKNTLFVAVIIGGKTYDELADAIDTWRDGGDMSKKRYMMAETSYDKLQDRLRERIRANPEERWLILSGTTLAEISAPPVSFRPA